MSDTRYEDRKARVALSPLTHRVKFEVQPRPHGRALVLTTYCGIVAFEEPFKRARLCPICEERAA